MKKISYPDPLVLRHDDSTYDTSNVGDAALLAVLKSAANAADADNEDADPTAIDSATTITATKPDSSPADSSSDESAIGKVSSPKKKATTDSGNEAKPTTEPENEQAEGSDESDSPASLKTAILLLRLTAQILSGEVPDDDLLPLMNVATAREAIEQARIEGERAGRNAIIEERLQPVSIGAPDLNGTPSPHRSRAASIFDLARNAK